jgi:hypothetical protein
MTPHEQMRALASPHTGIVDAVARCLAVQDDQFISGSRWRDSEGDRYRSRARGVLRTIWLYESGVRSGGMAP